MTHIANIFKWIGHMILCALYIALTCTITDFLSTPIKSFSDIVFVLLHWSTITIALFSILTLISLINRYLFSAIYTIFCFLSAILAYFRYTINFSFNTMILDIVFQNDIVVSADMITIPLILWVIIISIISILLAIFLITITR